MSAADTHVVEKPSAHDVTAPMERTMRANVRKLAEGDLSLMQSVQAIYTATPPVGTTKEDMMNPIFWSHVVRKLKPMFEIWAMPKDGAWYGKWLVIFADANNFQVKLKELAFYPLEELSEPELEGDPYLVKWISPPVRFGIIRKADKAVIKDRFETKEQAYAWKAQNLPTPKT